LVTPGPNEKFRGISALELSLIIEYAAVSGHITLMKRTNVRDNIGKAPELVLAEQMILATRVPPEEVAP
jgi:hypothetical protein